MSSNQGIHWSIDGRSYTLFGRTASLSGSQSFWVLPQFGLCEIEPRPLFADIVSILNQDIAAGDEHKIDHVAITTDGALRLALEGKLTQEILEAGQVTPDSLIVVIDILGRPRKVVIYSPDVQLPFDVVATLDTEGQVV